MATPATTIYTSTYIFSLCAILNYKIYLCAKCYPCSFTYLISHIFNISKIFIRHKVSDNLLLVHVIHAHVCCLKPPKIFFTKVYLVYTKTYKKPRSRGDNRKLFKTSWARACVLKSCWVCNPTSHYYYGTTEHSRIHNFFPILTYVGHCKQIHTTTLF